jgi:hypothetical protein
MEVHHHPTEFGSHSSRKKWTHYLWEFLMLFLAVFCGFLAEYQLEHKIEKDREKQYIRSLLDDLGEDTLILNENIEDCEGHMYRIDTLVRILNSDDVMNRGSDLYYLGRRASRGVRLALHDLTIQQMKNSGGFRLISKENVSKAIIEYYNQLVFIDYLQTIGMSEAEEYRKMAIDVFHPVVFNSIVNPDNSIAKPAGNASLLTYEPKVLVRLSGMLSYIRNTKLGLFKAETKMKHAAIELIQLIKKEYHIK